MFPYLFKFGMFELRVYSLMYILGLVIAIIFVRRRAKSLGLNPDHYENGIIIGFLGALVGARMYYVAFRWDYYAGDILSMLAIWKGGLAIHGAIFGAAMGGLLYARMKKFSFFTLADLSMPFLLLAQGIGRFGNFANGEAHGVPTLTPPSIIFRMANVFPAFWEKTLATAGLANRPEAVSRLDDIASRMGGMDVSFNGTNYVIQEYVPWGISFSSKFMPPAYLDFGTLAVHPTFFYEMILNFIGAAFLIYIWRKDEKVGVGMITGLYLVFYGFIRAFVTLFRADDLMLGVIRAPHLASIVMILVGVLMIVYVPRMKKPEVPHGT